MARHCNHCWGRGHNKRTCPKLTQQIKDNYDERLADCKVQGVDPRSDGHVSYYADQLGERLGVHPVTGAKVAKTQPRKCSYCKYKHGTWADDGLGHTRRNCATLAADLAAERAKNGGYRRRVFARMKADGIGPGMLVRIRQSGYGDNAKYTTNLVHGIEWGSISYYNRSAYAVIQLKELSADGGSTNLPLPTMDIARHEDSDDTISFGARWSVAHPSYESSDYQCIATAPTASLTPPADWFDGRCAWMDGRYAERKA
jgi:hypothetical protein